MEEFLASQMSNRIKIDFRSNEDLMKLFDYKSSESVFLTGDGKKTFLIRFKIADQKTDAPKKKMSVKKIKEILRIANKVLYGYKYKHFDYLVLEDQLNNARLIVTGENVYKFNRNGLSVEEVVKAPAGYFN